MYQVRRVTIGKNAQLDELARASGKLYSQTVVFFWRTVRHKGIWLKPKHLMRLFTSDKLHAHTSDACVQAFFAGLKSWRERKKQGDPDAKPPRRRKWYFRIEYKRSAMVRKEGKLRLSNGKGNEPLVLNWPWELPQTVVIHWTGNQYEAIATYAKEQPYGPFPPGAVAGVDLGEIHMAVAHDGEHTHITNGRLLRSKGQYRNKLQAKLNSRIDGRMKKGSRRRKKLIRSKKRQLKKIEHQIKDIEHKSTTRLISTLHANGVQTVVIGDVRAIRQDNDVGHTNNQKIHQWSHGSVRHKLTYNYHRDYSLKPDNQVSILTLQGRVIVPYTGYSKHVALLRTDAHIGAAKLWYDKPRKQFYLLISLEFEVAAPTPETQSSIVGVDVGQRYLAVTATPTNDASFYSGKTGRARASCQYALMCRAMKPKLHASPGMQSCGGA